MWASGQLDSAGTFAAGVWTFVEGGFGPFTAAIEVSGADLLEGPTSPYTANGGDMLQRLRLRARSGSDTVLVRGALRSTRAGSYDCYEAVLPIVIRGRDVRSLTPRTTRSYSVREGRWFRYGSEYLTAIDSTDLDNPVRIESPPRPIEEPEVRCPDCGLDSSVTVPLIVTVGKTGAVTWVDPRPAGGPAGGKVWRAAYDGVRRYRFEPARGDGKPIALWTGVQVRVVPGSH